MQIQTGVGEPIWKYMCPLKNYFAMLAEMNTIIRQCIPRRLIRWAWRARADSELCPTLHFG